MNLIDALYKKGEQVGWLIIHPLANGGIEQELILGALTDETWLYEGDEAHPVYLQASDD